MIKILGAKISSTESYLLVYKYLTKYLKEDSNSVYITVNNVHTVIEAVKNSDYKEIINNSFLSLPDGKPLSIYAKLKGNKNITRIFGPTFMEKTIEWGQKDELKHYFFGSSLSTLQIIESKIKEKYPHTIISGSFSPPFKNAFEKEENEDFINKMNESGADIYWIGLGAPKQEIWMYENYKKLNKGIMIGIGAGFDYLACKTKHAPEWMKNASLEWLYRLIQEPKRLWKRYLVTNSLFLWYILLEFFHLKKFDN